jgi:hypothetical protein
MVQHMVDAGVLSADVAHKHPDANRITRALGMQPEVDVELRGAPVPLQVNDVFLLCSDGLTDMLGDSDILELVNSSIYSGPSLSCQRLIERANQRGGHDNITVQLLRVLEAPPRRGVSEPTQVDVRNTLVDDASSPEATVAMNRPNKPELDGLGGSEPRAPTLVDYGPVRPTEPSLEPNLRGAPLSGQSGSQELARARRSGHNLVLVGLSIVVAIVVGVALWWLLGARRSDGEEEVPMPSGVELESSPVESTILVPEAPPVEPEPDQRTPDVGDAAPEEEQAPPAPVESAVP